MGMERKGYTVYKREGVRSGTPVALSGTVSKITENVLVAGVILRMVKLTTPPSLTVYIVGSNPTSISVNKELHITPSMYEAQLYSEILRT